MKNRISLLLVLLTVSIAANAQLYLGAKVGLNLANIKSSFANTTFNKSIGINGGATVKFNFTSTLGAQMDLLYSQMGSKAKMVTTADDGLGNITTTTTEDIYTFSYLQVPIFANFEIPIRSENLVPYRLTESVVSIHLQGGGYFGYALSNNRSTQTKTSTLDNLGNTTIDVLPKVSGANKKFNGIDFGLALGAGVSFKLSQVGRLTIDGRLLMGLSNFNSDKAYARTVSLTYPVMKNMVTQVQLGYIHRITKPKRWKS